MCVSCGVMLVEAGANMARHCVNISLARANASSVSLKAVDVSFIVMVATCCLDTDI